MSDLAPIVLFIYNRPEHARRAIAALAANPLAAESDLIIYADGPKKPEHLESVRQAREVARNVSGFRSLDVIERDRNLGLAKSIKSGVAEVCDTRGRAIVVEDDLLVAPTFLEFLNAGLDRYVDDPTVYQISGYMFPVALTSATDALFLPLISCWGWATWARAWKQFDVSDHGYYRLVQDGKLRAQFNLDGAYDYFGMLRDQVEGRIDSWGVRWLLSVFLQGGLVLYPRVSLVKNIGADGSGTHGAGVSALHLYAAGEPEGKSVERWPPTTCVDVQTLDRVKKLLADSRSHPIVRLFRRFVR